jgi:hypothetical protein
MILRMREHMEKMQQQMELMQHQMQDFIRDMQTEMIQRMTAATTNPASGALVPFHRGEVTPANRKK